MKQSIFFLGLLCTAAVAVEKEGDDPLQWLRDSIPGEPGVDYPILSSVQETSFTCEGKVFGGYYADPALGCQAYHVCLLDAHSGNMFPTSFLCPNGTLFQQQVFNCDWWYNVDCSAAESFYGLVQNAFGTSGGSGSNGGSGGQCPNVNPKPQAECLGQVSNCWSPGQPDTDCPNFGLCCFDGCSNTCVDSQFDLRPSPLTTPRPAPQTTSRPAPPAPQPTSRPTQPAPQPTSRPTQPAPQPTSRPTPPAPRPTPLTTPRPSIQTFAPSIIQPSTFETAAPDRITTGYTYSVPNVTLGISRPVSTTTAIPIPDLISTPATLYGAPPAGRIQGGRGRQGRNGARRKRLSKRVYPLEEPIF